MLSNIRWVVGHGSRAGRDLAFIALIAVVSFVTAARFDALETIVEWSHNYEHWNIDEIVVVLMILTIASSIFAWRRWQEAQSELAERKRVDEVLRVSEAELRAVFAAIPDIILVIDKNGRYLKIAPTNPDLLYRPPADLVGKTVHEVFPAEEANAFLGHIRRALETRQPVHTEYSLTIGDTGVWFAGTTTPMLDDAVLYMARDITERKRAEQALVQLAAIVESSDDAIFSKTMEGTIVSWNAGAERLFGYTAAEVKGRSVTMLLAPDRPNEEVTILERIKRGERMQHYETVRVRKDGSLVDISLSVSPIKDAAGVPTGISVIGRDITERKKLDRLKNEFVSTVSHELRTPLTSIRGSLGLLAGGVVAELPVAARGMIDIAYKNSERLVRLINDILDIEKIEAGKLAFNLKPVELTLLVEQALEANRGYAEQFGVSVELAQAAPGAMVMADADRLMQVLANLLSNAAKFSPANGVVTVDVTRHGHSLRVAVTDQGAGIPEAFQGRIFQKFAQADSSDTRQKGGTGLGLSITRAIVEKLGGQVGFTTQIGLGSTFYFDLPEWWPTAVPEASQPVGDARSRILICEDDRDIATLLGLFLKEAGFDSDIVATAAAAKQLLAQRHYVAMTLDLALPDQHGLALIRELRTQEGSCMPAIIVVSAAADEGRAALHGDAVGIADWIDKPIDSARLVRAVKQAAANVRGSRARILHLEDDGDLLNVVASILRDVADVIPVTTVEQARQQLEQESFDLAILDIELPDGDGLELLPLLNGRGTSPTPVILFSACEVTALTARQVAASLTKSRTSNEQLLETITALIEARSAVAAV